MSLRSRSRLGRRGASDRIGDGATAHSAAARLVPIIRTNLERYPVPPEAPIYANTVDKPLRRTLFRARVWRPALVQAGMLGNLTIIDDHTVRAGWTDATGAMLAKEFPTEWEAIFHIAKSCAGGLRFHDLRHSYATWFRRSSTSSSLVGGAVVR